MWEFGQLLSSSPQSRQSLIQVAEWQLCPIPSLYLGFAIGNYFIGFLVDRFGVTKSLIFASLLISANFLFCALSEGLFSIILSHFFLGLGTAAGFGPLIADTSHWFAKKRG